MGISEKRKDYESKQSSCWFAVRMRIRRKNVTRRVVRCGISNKLKRRGEYANEPDVVPNICECAFSQHNLFRKHLRQTRNNNSNSAQTIDNPILHHNTQHPYHTSHLTPHTSLSFSFFHFVVLSLSCGLCFWRRADLVVLWFGEGLGGYVRLRASLVCVA